MRLPLLHSLHVLQVAILSNVLHYFSSVHVLQSSVTLSSCSPSCHSLQCLALFFISLRLPLLNFFMFSKLPVSPLASICFRSVCIFHCYTLFMFSKLPFSPVAFIISHQSMSSTVVLHSLHVLQVAILSSALHYFPSVHVLHCYILFMLSKLPLSSGFQVTIVSSGFHYLPSERGFRCYILCMFLKLPFAPVASILSPQSSSFTVTLPSCSPSYHSFSASYCYPSFLWVSTFSVTPLLILQRYPLYTHVCCTMFSCVTPRPMASCFYPSVHQLHVFHSDSLCLLLLSFPSLWSFIPSLSPWLRLLHFMSSTVTPQRFLSPGHNLIAKVPADAFMKDQHLMGDQVPFSGPYFLHSSVFIFLCK